jgi:cytochrome b involved in lipid metabolism
MPTIDKEGVSASLGSLMKFDSVEEVSEYCKKQNRELLVLNDEVIDIAGYKHPGGDSFISDAIGTDISFDFFNQNHSDFALRLAKDRKIGEITSKHG